MSAVASRPVLALHPVLALACIVVFALGFLGPVGGLFAEEAGGLEPFFSSWNEFRSYALEAASARAVAEMNRAMAQLRLEHGDVVLHMDPEAALRQLAAKGYMKLDLPWSFESDPVRLVEGRRFESLAHGARSPGDRPMAVSVEGDYAKRAILDEDPRLRWFVLAVLAEKAHLSPVKFVLRGFLRERRLDLVGAYVELLKTERFIRAAEKVRSVPESLKKRILLFERAAKTLDQRAQGLFLCVMFTETRPPLDLPLLVRTIDLDFAFPYLLRLFKSYPRRWIEEFAHPFKRGFGDRHELLMKLFTHFPDSPICMQALAFAFVNRKKGHFSLMQPAIVRTWEEMTGLTHGGDDAPFLAWYRAHKPPRP